ncbi:MAG: hypothetical protein HY270_01015 [Deltaproteobacteria bacterium]|nr:hypothetical protein [Deltaproteobacteria bacterium]
MVKKAKTKAPAKKTAAKKPAAKKPTAKKVAAPKKVAVQARRSSKTNAKYDQPGAPWWKRTPLPES